MYHGTSANSAAQIELGGFCPSVDGMLGRGVYLSRDISKAQQYGAIILMCQVSVGRVARIDHQGHPLQKSWSASGFDTAWVPPRFYMVSCGLEEACISDPAKIRVLDRVRA
ncbi:unnamed protein product [Durusdinium trenchii]|uniref:PARP catalytic domain-containing protein n=2 Tax=Durusdinium trenchii TaxID=1381693 RepID=A0ABP0L1F2_9DINO